MTLQHEGIMVHIFTFALKLALKYYIPQLFKLVFVLHFKFLTVFYNDVMYIVIFMAQKYLH